MHALRQSRQARPVTDMVSTCSARQCGASGAPGIAGDVHAQVLRMYYGALVTPWVSDVRLCMHLYIANA